MRPPTPHRAERCGHLLGLLVVAVALVAASCVPTGERPELTDERVDDGARPLAAPPCPLPGEPFERFGSTVVRVQRPEGPVERCVLVADTFELRARGLMEAADLAGYDGMIFAFPEDSLGGFWMVNTVMPLSIAFVDSGGQVVATFDMEPCPEALDCPSYEPPMPYRWALEVSQGGLGGFGLGPAASFDPDTLPGAIE